MATKRRRVWANWYPALGEAPAYWGTRLGTKSDARMAAQPGAEMVSLIERLPGDVVLSRGEAAARKHAAERLEVWLKGMKMESFDECDHIRQSCGDVGCTRPVTDAIALLRGRR